MGRSAAPPAPSPMPPNPPFLLFSMPLWQTLYSHWLFIMLGGLVILTLIADTMQRLALRNARGDRCKTSFVNRFVAELMLFGMAAVTIMTIYEASARELLTEHVDQLHWVDVYVSVSAILLIWVGAWVWCFTVKKREYYQNLMTTSNVGRQSLDLQVAGGYISRLLAQEYGLGSSYNFGMYVREIAAQGVVDLIDVNMLGWIGFLTPAIVGLSAIAVIDDTTAPLSRELAIDALVFVIIYGWMWLVLSLLLHGAGLWGRHKLREFYGTASLDQVRSKVSHIKSVRSARVRSVKHEFDGPNAPAGGIELETNPRMRGSSAPGPSTVHSLSQEDNHMSRSKKANREWLQGAQELAVGLSEAASVYLSSKSTLPNPSSEAPNASILTAFGDKYGREPVKRIWLTTNLWWLKQLLQVVMLNMCGQIAVYVLTVSHYIDNLPCPLDKLRESDFSVRTCGTIGAYFHFLALFPPLAIMGCLLPMTMAVYAEFEAYAVPRADILDNVLADADMLASHQQYVREKLIRRREEATTPSTPNAEPFVTELLNFEAFFPATHTKRKRYLAAMLDISRGTAETYTDPRECFFVGMLNAARVPCSRERLDHLNTWVRESLGEEPPSVAAIFKLLDLEPLPPLE